MAELVKRELSNPDSWMPFEPEWDGVLIDKISITNADGSVTDIPISKEQSVTFTIHYPFSDAVYKLDNPNKAMELSSEGNHNYTSLLDRINNTFSK